MTAVAVAGTSVAAVSPTLTSPNGNAQSIAITFKPHKLSKTRPSPVTLDVVTKLATTANANGVPVPTSQVLVDFDKGARIFSRGYPTCAASQLENASTEAALAACKRAKIGGGTATVLLPVGTRVFTIPQTVTAFNGVPQGGKPVVLLHVYGEAPVQTATVLTGVVGNYGKEGFGPRLTVTVPPIGGGVGALTEFHVSIFKTFNYKGEKRSYVSATCQTKKLKGRGKFIFVDGQSVTPTLKESCAQRK